MLARVLTALILVAVSASPAVSQGNLNSLGPSVFAFDGPNAASSVVGDAGNSTGSAGVYMLGPVRGMIDGEPYAISAVIIDETGDEPCGLQTLHTPLNGTRAGVPIETMNWFDGGDSECAVENVAWKTVRSRPNTSAAADSPVSVVKNVGSESGLIGVKGGHDVLGNFPLALSNLATCTKRVGASGGRNDLVKGLRANFVGLDATRFAAAGLIANPDTAVSKQPHCEIRTFAASTCPPNHVAIRLRIVTENVGNHESITGLRLICRPVKLAFPTLDPATVPTPSKN